MSVLDQVIRERRSTRHFSDEIPSKGLIESVIEAGLLAPFAAASSSNRYARRFVVVSRGNSVLLKLADVVQKQAQKAFEELSRQSDAVPEFGVKAKNFLGRLEMTMKQGPLGIGSAPYYIVVAEPKGIPEAQMQSIAHCMQNMWLKATELGLGFQLVSITGQMGDNSDFCKLVNLPVGEYKMDGCAIGYPALNLPPRPEYPSVSEITTWLL
ncbi:Nitroreductase family [Acididesulfobacillus acetoxydans]|uniref:Nitroreductase n=1 Tax=Acididesulfobacillus acetoxydans TaxID=1561005 RepID=A0A8S0WQ45_9FIRM|nr:nitroreductase family protein [Acididesulfobacillus acetoxydans]CAA7602384.1 Nitroreductase family [Acididesulfobacillus acetoxydans]CEJ08381.1 Nitroreductase [Acididesulfobacillus acetoxydans]